MKDFEDPDSEIRRFIRLYDFEENKVLEKEFQSVIEDYLSNHPYHEKTVSRMILETMQTDPITRIERGLQQLEGFKVLSSFVISLDKTLPRQILDEELTHDILIMDDIDQLTRRHYEKSKYFYQRLGEAITSTSREMGINPESAVKDPNIRDKIYGRIFESKREAINFVENLYKFELVFLTILYNYAIGEVPKGYPKELVPPKELLEKIYEITRDYHRKRIKRVYPDKRN